MISAGSTGVGHKLGELPSSHGYVPVSFLRDQHLGEPDPDITLTPGGRINFPTVKPS